MSDHALAFWIAAPGRGEIRREALAAPAPGEVIVQALFSGVSRGTESLVFRGGVPASEYSRMRAPFQAGQFPAPVKYGYSSVGQVVQGAPALLGRTVFCLYPHQTRYVVPESAVLPLPQSVPAQRAVLAPHLETALNAVWDAVLLPGHRITVIGAGSIGCLTAWLAARIPGCDVELIDTNPQRRGVAQALGLRFATAAEARGEADVVLHASASPQGLGLALQLAAFEATIVELSWYGEQQVSLPLGEAFHSRRLTLKASQVGAVAPSHRARWSATARLQMALGMLDDPALDALINSESRFQDLPQVMPRLADSPGDVIMHRVRYD